MFDYATFLIYGCIIVFAAQMLYGTCCIVRMFLHFFNIWPYTDAEVRRMDKEAEMRDREMRQYCAAQRRDNIFW